MVVEAGRQVIGMRKQGRPRKVYERPNKPLREYTRDDVWHEGERLAADHLEDKGLDIIERNWRCPYGEVDIVAMDERVVFLVEVKCRIGLPRDVQPELSVTPEKLARYERMAKYFITRHPDIHSIRVDVVAINLVSDDAAHLRRYHDLYVWDD